MCIYIYIYVHYVCICIYIYIYIYVYIYIYIYASPRVSTRAFRGERGGYCRRAYRRASCKAFSVLRHRCFDVSNNLNMYIYIYNTTNNNYCTYIYIYIYIYRERERYVLTPAGWQHFPRKSNKPSARSASTNLKTGGTKKTVLGKRAKSWLASAGDWADDADICFGEPVRGGRVLLTEIPLPQIARLASNCSTGV